MVVEKNRYYKYVSWLQKILTGVIFLSLFFGIAHYTYAQVYGDGIYGSGLYNTGNSANNSNNSPVVLVAPGFGATSYSGQEGSSSTIPTTPAPTPLPIPTPCTPGALFNTSTGAPCSASTVNTTSTTTSTLGLFTRDLQLATVHPEVKILQHYLNTHGFILANSGPGSLGHETTMFGYATRATLIRFQKAKNIKPASGYFGPITRAYINSH